MRNHRIPTLSLVLLLACASVPAAQASGRSARGADAVERVEALAQAASELVRAGEYAEAILRFVEAYDLEPAAALLYNIAFVYDRKLGDAEQARIYYLRYIAAPDAEPEGIQRARDRLAVLRPPETVAPKREPDVAPLEATSPSDVRLALLQPQPKDTTAWSLVGVGVVSMSISAGFLHMAGNTSDQANGSGEPDRTILSARTDDQELIAWILLGAGAASAVTGSLMLFLDETDDTALRVLPSVAPGLASVALEARW